MDSVPLTIVPPMSSSIAWPMIPTNSVDAPNVDTIAAVRRFDRDTRRRCCGGSARCGAGG
jgi:hypothetical protein